MNPYETLDLQPDASAEQVKAAYIRLAKESHPDRFTGADRLAAALRYRELTEAFSQLKDRGGAAAETTEPVPLALDQGMQIDLASYTPPAKNPVGRAKDALEKADYAEALACIGAALKEDPDKHEYHALHAKILDASGGDRRTLVAALEHCLRLDERDADSAIRLAETYQTLGMPSRATRYREWAYHLAPQHPHFQQETALSKHESVESGRDLGGSIRGLLAETKGLLGRFGKKG